MHRCSYPFARIRYCTNLLTAAFKHWATPVQDCLTRLHSVCELTGGWGEHSPCVRKYNIWLISLFWQELVVSLHLTHLFQLKDYPENCPQSLNTYGEIWQLYLIILIHFQSMICYQMSVQGGLVRRMDSIRLFLNNPCSNYPQRVSFNK